jgi:hypothetical protein
MRRQGLVVGWLLLALAASAPALSAPARRSKKDPSSSSSSSSDGNDRRGEPGGARRDTPGGGDRTLPASRDEARRGDKDADKLGSAAEPAASEHPAAGREPGEAAGRETPAGAGRRAEPGALAHAAHEAGAGRREAAGTGPDRAAFTPAEIKLAKRVLASERRLDRQRTVEEQISEQRADLKSAAGRIANPTRDPKARQELTAFRKLYPDMVHAPSVTENATRYQEMCERLNGFHPDAILAMERGGGLVADVVKAKDRELGEKVVSLERAPDLDDPKKKAAAKAAGYIGAMTRLYDQGQRRFAVVDFEMGSFTSDGLHPAVQEFLREHTDAEVQTFWIKETAQLGSNIGQGSTVERFKTGTRPDDRRLVSNKLPVNWAVGEDVSLITGKAAPAGASAPKLPSAPIHLFDDDGHVTHTIEPRRGETSRDIVVGLLSGRTPLP